jgi:hypothetical protein
VLRLGIAGQGARHVQDCAAPPTLIKRLEEHLAHGRAAHEEGARRVHGQRRLPTLESGIVQGSIAVTPRADASDVVDAVHTTETPDAVGYRGIDLRFLRQVGRPPARLTAVRGDRIG